MSGRSSNSLKGPFFWRDRASPTGRAGNGHGTATVRIRGDVAFDEIVLNLRPEVDCGELALLIYTRPFVT
jgi:hypothetical protein